MSKVTCNLGEADNIEIDIFRSTFELCWLFKGTDATHSKQSNLQLHLRSKG